MLQKWVCNKCGFETTDKPSHSNPTCTSCKSGRFRCLNLCECGKWFHPDRMSQQYCSKDCDYKYKKSGGKKGKHYPHSQRARIAVCPVCGQEFRAVKEYKGKKPFIVPRNAGAEGLRMKRSARSAEKNLNPLTAKIKNIVP